MDAIALRSAIVKRMEAANEASSEPIYWRLGADGRAEKGYENGQPWPSKWIAVHPLSPYLLAEASERRERIEAGIWF